MAGIEFPKPPSINPQPAQNEVRLPASADGHVRRIGTGPDGTEYHWIELNGQRLGGTSFTPAPRRKAGRINLPDLGGLK